MYYYTMLALTAGAFVLCFFLLRSRAGYYWQAIRENEEAAQALGINTFRWKMAAVAISAAMTSISGVFFAFYYNNLFPEQIFHISRSIEIILGPVIGGIGTLFGPILGAAVLAPFRRNHRAPRRARLGGPRHQAGVLRHRAARGGDVPSARNMAHRSEETEDPCLKCGTFQNPSAGCARCAKRRSRFRRKRQRTDRAERRGQDHDFQHGGRRVRAGYR